MSKQVLAIFYRTWFILFFLILCFGLYEQGAFKIDKEYKKLSLKLSELRMAEKTALEKHDKLLLQLNGESDPALVELILMKTLGVAPEGTTKVFFTTDK